MPAGDSVVQAVSVYAGLQTTKAPGKVVAVHHRASTLETVTGELITLAAPELGNGPNAVLVARRPWSVGTRFTPIATIGLRFTAGPALEWNAASRWSAADSAPMRPPTVDNAGTLAAALAAYSIRVGLLPIVLGNDTAASDQRALARQAAPLIAALPDAEAARGLIGLGPGATPAGDDLIAGLLLTLHYAGAPQTSALRDVARAAQTTRLGRAMLRWAARGEAREDTLRLLRDLFHQPWPSARPTLETVLHYGATSGADIIAGILIGLRALRANAVSPGTGISP
jgi:hypothetical protein